MNSRAFCIFLDFKLELLSLLGLGRIRPYIGENSFSNLTSNGFCCPETGPERLI